MKVGDLFIALGIQADTGQIDKLQSKVDTFAKHVRDVGLAFTAASYGLYKFVDGTLTGVVAMDNLSRQTGLSTEKLQKWQQAAQLSNLSLSAEEVGQSIGNLQKNLAAIRIGQGNIAPFQLLGIDVGGDAFSVLEQLRSRIKGLDRPTATNLITQLGLTSDFLNVLELSNEEFAKLSQNTFLSRGQQNDIMQLGYSFKALTLNLKSLKDQAVARIAPSLKELVDGFFKWLNTNGSKVIDTMATLAKVFSSFVTAVGNSIGMLGSFLENTIGIENGIKAIAIAVSFLMLQFKPLLAILFLVIGLLDDIATYKKFGKERSLFGGVYETFGVKKENETPEEIQQRQNKGLGRVQKFLANNPKTAGFLSTAPIVGSFVRKQAVQGMVDQAKIEQQSSSITNNINVVQNIQGSGNPKEAGKVSAEELKKIQAKYQTSPF